MQKIMGLDLVISLWELVCDASRKGVVM